ncbi:MAG: hypothetical protein P4L53_23795 [Candidatus Obscuribacterales bacterium]|nr:hypothetical protein [Candidatus Obscuribacterales bacterium]
MANTQNREISVRQLMLARFCTHSALTTPELRQRAEAMRSDDRKHRRLVKDVARSLLKDDQKKAAAQVQEKVATRTLSEQKLIIRKARKIAEARLAGLEEGIDLEMGVQRRWTNTETGWTVLFQPNRVEVLSDEEGDFVQVLGWTDRNYVPGWLKDTARTFGLLEFIEEKGEFRIKMVIKNLVHGGTLWEETLDSPEVAIEQLRDVQEIINRVEQARVSDRVPPRTAGKHCNGCPVKLACRQGQRFLNSPANANNSKSQRQAA